MLCACLRCHRSPQHYLSLSHIKSSYLSNPPPPWRHLDSTWCSASSWPSRPSGTSCWSRVCWSSCSPSSEYSSSRESFSHAAIRPNSPRKTASELVASYGSWPHHTAGMMIEARLGSNLGILSNEHCNLRLIDASGKIISIMQIKFFIKPKGTEGFK